MSSKELDKLQNLMVRRTESMRKILDDEELGPMARTSGLHGESIQLAEDLLVLLTDMHERRLDDMERDYDDIDPRGRDNRGRGSRGDSRDSRSGHARGWNDRRDEGRRGGGYR